MALEDDIDDQIAGELVKPASTTIEGNTVARRNLTELQDLKDRTAANEQASKPSGGIKRERFRHGPPGGGAPN
jgi:hypothetical protein